MSTQANRQRFDCSDCGDSWFVSDGRVLSRTSDERKAKVIQGICPSDGAQMTMTQGWKHIEGPAVDAKKSAAEQALYVLVMNVAEAAAEGQMPTRDFTRDMAGSVVEAIVELVLAVQEQSARDARGARPIMPNA